MVHICEGTSHGHPVTRLLPVIVKLGGLYRRMSVTALLAQEMLMHTHCYEADVGINAVTQSLHERPGKWFVFCCFVQ